MFNSYDVDDNGYLDKGEFYKVVKSLIESLQQTMNTNLLQINEYMTKNEELLKKIKALKSSKKGNLPDNSEENEKLALTISAQKVK